MTLFVAAATAAVAVHSVVAAVLAVRVARLERRARATEGALQALIFFRPRAKPGTPLPAPTPEEPSS